MADEGLKIDPYNADLYDLKSNACLFLSDFKCAVDALETLYATDSTKADTLFFTKIAAAAARARSRTRCDCSSGRRSGCGSIRTTRRCSGYLNKAYTLTGQTDSVVAVTNRIMAKDTTDVVPGAERRPRR